MEIRKKLLSIILSVVVVVTAGVPASVPAVVPASMTGFRLPIGAEKVYAAESTGTAAEGTGTAAGGNSAAAEGNSIASDASETDGGAYNNLGTRAIEACATPESGYYAVEDVGPTNEELFEIYANNTLGLSDENINYSVDYSGSLLQGNEKRLYDLLKPEIKKVADGELSSASFTFTVNEVNPDFKSSYTAAELGVSTLVANGAIAPAAKTAFCNKIKEQIVFDYSSLFNALLNDCSYEFYWNLKTTGNTSSWTSYRFGTSGDCLEISDVSALKLTLNFTVDPFYRNGSGDTYKYTVDTSKTGAAKTTAAKAKAIVTEAKDKDDYNKLKYYKDKICDLNTYNDYAAKNSGVVSTTTIAPWQIIYVFDGDPATNVVCEGYSKAFAYLCELTDFDSNDIKVYSVTGDMTDVLGGDEPHMWNIAHMDDGKNYLVDVTNCDSGTIGNPDKLFLIGTDQKVTTVEDGRVVGYGKILGYYYVYDSDTLNAYDSSQLELSASNYTYTPKTAATLTNAPTAKSGLRYTGSAQALINNDGTASGGSLVYSLSESGTYSSTMPKATYAGNYRVWYKVKGDSSHTSTEPTYIDVSIAKGTYSDSVVYEKSYSQTVNQNDSISLAQFLPSGAGTASYAVKSQVHEGASEDTISSATIDNGMLKYSVNKMSSFTANTKTDVTVTITTTNYDDFDKVIRIKRTECTHPAVSVVVENKTAASCETAGENIKKCTLCGKVVESGLTVPALNHSWNSGVVTKEATETETGTRKYTCTRAGCGKTRTEDIPVLSHTHSWKAYFTTDTEPSCTEPGSKSIHCASCSETKETTVIPALGHAWNDGVVVKEVTTTEDGIKRYTCTRTGCYVTKDEPIYRHVHDWKADFTIDIEPTCTEPGSKSIHCRSCEETKDETAVSPLGHSWDFGTVVKEATEKDKGLKRYACTRSGCTATKTEDIPVLAHVHKWAEEHTVDVAPSCEKPGRKSIRCSGCTQTKDVTIIPALGHDWDDGAITKEATYTEKGEKVYICKNDASHKIVKEIPTLETSGDVIEEDFDEFDEADFASDKLRVVGITDAEYTGSAVTFDLRVYKGNKLLKEGSDYKIKYTNNKNACLNINAAIAPTVTITGKGSYAGDMAEASFTIKPRDIADFVVSNDTVFEGGSYNPLPTLTTNNGKKLKAGIDYTVEYDSKHLDGYTEPGNYEITISGCGNYTGSLTSSFRIVAASEYQLLSKASVKGAAKSLKYTGKPLEQNISNIQVILGNETLQASDYTVSYLNNTEVGTASMIIRAAEGSKRFAGEKVITFKITGTPISKALATYDKSQTYTGKLIKPSISLALKDGTRLTQGKDYEVSYMKNVNAGTATILLTGKGAYSGSVKKTFKIKPVILTNNDNIEVSILGKAEMNEKGAYTVDVEVRNDGKLLTKGIDYTISYKNNKLPAGSDQAVNPGKEPTVVIKGKGNYTKTTTTTFEIEE